MKQKTKNTNICMTNAIKNNIVIESLPNCTKGITLISLVITIIVLLILATVAISIAIDSNGLFARARKAAEDWNTSVINEEREVENVFEILNEVTVGGVIGGGEMQPPDVEVKSITLNPTDLILTEGDNRQITALIDPPNATDQNITWSSKSDEVATVEKNDDGKTATVTARTKGSTIITASSGEQSAQCNVTVASALPDGWNDESVTDVVKDESGRKAPIPQGYVASNKEGENKIEDGLVIYEGTDSVKDDSDAMETRNQYVWIPVDDINDMVMCRTHGASATLTFDATTNKFTCPKCSSDTEPKLAGRLYATTTGNEFNSELKNQVYNADSGLREPAIVHGYSGNQHDAASKDYHGLGVGTEGAKKFLAQLQSDFDNMAKSVATYKGFYISRYEVQTGGASKKGQKVMTGETQMWYGLYKTIKDANTQPSVESQMIWGSQYDQVMRFVNGRNDGLGFAFDVKTQVLARHKNGYDNSGNNDNDLVCNIYDLEGNYFEWTAEAGYDEYRVYRGRLYRLFHYRVQPRGQLSGGSLHS